MKLKVRNDNIKENTCCIDKYERIQYIFWLFRPTRPKGLAS